MTTFTTGPWGYTCGGRFLVNLKPDGSIPLNARVIAEVERCHNEVDARLIASAPQLFNLVGRLTHELIQQIKDIGGCDHSVGICICDLVRLQDEAEAVIKQIKGEQ